MRASAVITLALIALTAGLAAPGCGGDDEKPEEKKQGDSIECGGLVCDPVILGQGYPPVPACCADGDACGLDGTQFEQYGAVFDEPCQPRDQPGELDDECPASTPVETDLGSLSFRGCCKPSGTCGYLLDRAFGIIPIGLGCVDATPFLDSGAPESCTPGPGGAGGAGGGSNQ